MAEFLKRLRCLVGRHSPSRRSVRYEGHLKVGPCKYCGIELEKSADGRWVHRHAIGGKSASTAVEED
ncbi:hypothetical protein [Novosphingobium sediminis]|uniref:hypothetical protein n=1 Tax=Novosphingobium sediminis TaxID=707214 RepID=UPI0011BEB9EE|nr:hypothetical protein [Novosphingobium sediminis]